MALDIKTLRVRSITASVFVAVLVSCIYFSYYSFLAFFFFVSMWALKEFYSLVEKMNVKPFRALGFISGLITFISIFSRQFPEGMLGMTFIQNAIYLVPFLLAIQFLFSANSDPFLSYVYTISGVLYCIIPFALLVQIPLSFDLSSFIPSLKYDYFKVLGVIFLIWANDTFAYIGGSLIGKNKLYEAASPGKTWEGTTVGIVACVSVGFVLNLNNTFSHNYWWPLIALFVGVFGTIGDLIESLIKRKAGVKDSGSIMPGHGGILDRFDSLLFVSPFVFLITKLAEN